jgi:hypothetical protein
MGQFVSGLDPGKLTNPAALVVLEQTQGPDPLDPRRPCWHYLVRALKQWPLGTTYTTVTAGQPGVGEQVRDFYRASAELHGSQVAVGQAGVGEAVVDILRGLNPPCVLVGLVETAGERWKRDGLTFHVAKSLLVSLLVQLTHCGRLTVNPRLRLASLYAAQLAAFREKRQAGQQPQDELLGSSHYDLISATMMACWLGEVSPPFRRSDVTVGQRETAQLPGGVYSGTGKLPGRW